MKVNQIVLITDHEDKYLIGKIGIICAPVRWDPDSDEVDVQVDTCGTTFVKKDCVIPITVSKNDRQKIFKLYEYENYKVFDERRKNEL